MEYKKRWLSMKITLISLKKKENNYVIGLVVFQLDRQEQYISENILIYGVEENKEDNDDGKKVLFKIADELQIDLEDNELQRVH